MKKLLYILSFSDLVAGAIYATDLNIVLTTIFLSFAFLFFTLAEQQGD